MEGQKKLKAAHVFCVGTGGLGSPLALYLAAAGVGTLGLVDFDVVDYTNLQRQILHHTADVGRLKLDSAIDKLKAINPLCASSASIPISTARTLCRFSKASISSPMAPIISPRAIWSTTPACSAASRTCMHPFFASKDRPASLAKDGPCYRCLYPEPPPPGLVPSCAEGGVLGVVPGLLGVIQATEVIKLILGVGEPLIGRLLLVDALAMRFRELKVRKNPECPVCGANPTIKD